MAIKTRAILKTQFENGDVPTGNDYADLIDSALNLADTSAQTATSDIYGSLVRYTTVCANSIFTDNLAAANATIVSGATVNAANISAQDIRTSSIRYKIPYGSLIKKSNNTISQNTSAFTGFSASTGSGQSSSHFLTSNSGRLTYRGSTTADFYVSYSVGGTLDNIGAADTVSFALGKNGVVLTGTRTTFSMVSSRSESGSGSGITTMVCGDFIEIFFENKNSATNTLTIRSYGIVTYALSW